MKARNKVLFNRYDLYFRGIWEKPRNYPSLLDIVQRRIGWRVDVLRCCDNWEEIVSTDRKALSNFCNPKVFHFPKKRRVPPEVFDPEWALPHKYRIVRKKNNRYKVVLNKYKPFPTGGRTLVVDYKRGYIREVGDKVWYHPDSMDFGCDFCADLGTCFNGRHYKSFCEVGAKCGIGHGNTWQEVRE